MVLPARSFERQHDLAADVSLLELVIGIADAIERERLGHLHANLASIDQFEDLLELRAVRLGHPAIGQDELLPASDGLRILPLDVTDAASITHAVAEAGPIDALVNNAGFGAPAPIELTPLETTRALFETNLIGTLAVTQAVLPQFRSRRAGVIINISSSTTLRPLPVIALYRASKAAVNALTESLTVELKPFNIRVHLILPGRSPETRFGSNALPYMQGQHHADYAPMIEQFVAHVRNGVGPMTYSGDVAEAIWRAATDAATPPLTAAGADAEAWLAEAG